MHARFVQFGLVLLAFLSAAVPFGNIRAQTPDRRAPLEVRLVSSAVPFPRGLVLKDGDLYVVARGRVRDSGGVDVRLDDRAGTLWVVDPTVSEPLHANGEAVARNGRLFAEPTDPPFKLLDRSLQHATDDERTDRPYCGLRWHERSGSFFICAFSGIDLAASDPAAAEAGAFRKNYTDAVLRFDTRTGRWSEIERHDPAAGANYPHQGPLPDDHPPLSGWAKGPDNLVVIGDTLVVAAKDNSRLIAYDLRQLISDPDAAPPAGKLVLGEEVFINGQPRQVLGHSALAYCDGWLYVAFRTTSEVIRLPVVKEVAGAFAVDPRKAELLALFDPWIPESGRPSANLTDIALGPDGDVFVVSAHPARIFRFAPDAHHVHDFRSGRGQPWIDLAAATDNPQMKSENLLVADDGSVFVTSGDAYGREPGLGGAIYVIRETRGWP